MHTLLLATVLIAAAPPVEVQTLDGRTLVGSLVQLDSQGLSLETADGRVSLTNATLMGLVVEDTPDAAEPAPQVWVELVDGSSLHGTDFTLEGKTARLRRGDAEAIEIPSAALASVRLAESSEAAAAEWSRIVGIEHRSDVLVVRAGETIDYHQGVLRDVSLATVQFELDGEALSVKRAKVFGLVYYRPPGDRLAEPICRVVDAAGSQWSVASLDLADGLTWTTPGGVKRTEPLSRIRKIDFSGGNVVFLSDLRPESVTVTPYFGAGGTLPLLAEVYGLRTDQNLGSGPLRLDSKEYRKGLAMHSRTEVVYRLPERFRRFEAVVGIDDSVGANGNVRLVISGDDRVLLEATVAGADAPRTVELDVAGVRRLTILADFGEGMDVADHLDLCEARIIK